jgi:hypothetical protein
MLHDLAEAHLEDVEEAGLRLGQRILGWCVYMWREVGMVPIDRHPQPPARPKQPKGSIHSQAMAPVNQHPPPPTCNHKDFHLHSPLPRQKRRTSPPISASSLSIST